MFILAVFFLGVNMKGVSSKTETLIVQSIPFSIDEAYVKDFEEQNFVKKFAKMYQDAKKEFETYQGGNIIKRFFSKKKTVNKAKEAKTKEILILLEDVLSDLKKQTSFLKQNSLTVICSKCAEAFIMEIEHFNKNKEVEFIKNIIQTVQSPNVLFKNTYKNGNFGSYDHTNNTLSIPDPLMVYAMQGYARPKFHEEYVGTIVHEFIHHYDYNQPEIMDLYAAPFKEMLKNFETNYQGTEDNKPYDLVSYVLDKIGPITVVVGSINRMHIYEKELHNMPFTLIKLKSTTGEIYAYTQFRCKEYCREYFSEIIPNICSVTAFKSDKDCKNEFLLNLNSAMAQENVMLTKKNTKEAFEFLHEFFEEYQKAAKKSGLELPEFLTKGIEAVESTYTTVSEEMRKAQQQSHKIGEQKNLPIQLVINEEKEKQKLDNPSSNLKQSIEHHLPQMQNKVQQQEGAPVYERGRAHSWAGKLIEKKKNNLQKTPSLD